VSVMVAVEGTVLPDRVDDFRKLLERIIPETRCFRGNQFVTTYLDVDDTSRALFLELWDTRAQQEECSAWRDETGVTAELTRMLKAPPTVTYYADTRS